MGQPTQFYSHPRTYNDLKFAYPVISRRSRGLSIGLNLNPDKVCNWDCPYCQVDRTTPSDITEVDIRGLISEVRMIVEDAQSGLLWEHPRFSSTPEYYRRVRDFALAGDGEPTSFRGFPEVIDRLINLRHDLDINREVSINVLTNASLFHQPHVSEGLALLANTRSEIWCKLDAGTEEWFQKVNRSRFSLEHCLNNMQKLAQKREITIQSLFFVLDGQAPDRTEIATYIERLRWLAMNGGRIHLVQVYTIARSPSEAQCTPLPNEAIDAIVSSIRAELPHIDVQGFYGKLPD